jgi:hypothetical protein
MLFSFNRIFGRPWLPTCVLCKNTVNLETCKTDEYGQAVHEDCYALKIAMPNRKPVITVRPLPGFLGHYVVSVGPY